MTTPTVRDAVVDVLRERKLTTLFANPGSTEVPFLSGLPSDLDFVLALHESSVVGIATGFAIGRSEPAVALLHTTAGLGNAVGALATARVNRAPLVVIVGQQDRRHLAHQPFLAGRLEGLAGDYPVWVDQPVRPQDLPGSISRAYHEAMTGRGPALVIAPMDDWTAPAEEPGRPGGCGPGRPRSSGGSCGRRHARDDARRGGAPGDRRRERRRRRGDLGGARPDRRGARRARLAGVVRRPRGVSPRPSSVRRPPARAPGAPPVGARAVRRRARRRSAGFPAVPVRSGPPIPGRHAGGGRDGRRGRGTPERRRARGPRTGGRSVRRARAAGCLLASVRPKSCLDASLSLRSHLTTRSAPGTSSMGSPGACGGTPSCSRRRRRAGRRCSCGFRPASPWGG